ncbi:MAG: two-component regulator propeller domain-containing protein [Bacteroidota bacterium]
MIKNSVVSLFEDRKGNIWAGTYEGGLNRFDGKSFTNFTTDQGLPDNKLSIVTQGRNGNLLIRSWGGGVSIIRKNRVDRLARSNVSQKNRLNAKR